MQIHEVAKPNQKTKRRVGRGGKRGNYSGRGIKGQRSRAGAGIRPQIRDYFAKIPKLRGMNRKPGQHDKIGSKFGRGTHKKPPVFELNLNSLNQAVKDGDTVTPLFLVQRKLVQRYKGRIPRVKILGNGTLTKKITADGVALSSAARKQIEAAGGSIAEPSKTNNPRRPKA